MKSKKSKPKVKEKKNDDNIIKFDYMKTNKDNIINVIKCPTDINIINDIINRFIFNKFTKINRIIYFDKNDKIYTINRTNIYIVHIWDYSIFNPSNPLYQSSNPCIPNYSNLGIPVHTFVFDMCDHISSWLSEPNVSFRLTFTKTPYQSVKPAICKMI